MEFDTKSLDSHSTDKTYYSNFVLGAPAASLFAVRINTQRTLCSAPSLLCMHIRGGATHACFGRYLPIATLSASRQVRRVRTYSASFARFCERSLCHSSAWYTYNTLIYINTRTTTCVTLYITQIHKG